MLFSSATTCGSSQVQGPLWGRRANDWLKIQESQSLALYNIVLKALALTRDCTLLDVGCGAGMFCELAALRGTSAMGLDASNGLLNLARHRALRSTFFEGEMEALPFVDQTFDVVTLLNSLQHATTPLKVLIETRRVLRPGGRVAIAAWARPEQCQIADYFRALDELLPIDSPNTPAAFSFSTEGAISKLVARAGFSKMLEAQALTIWDYPDEDTALRGLLSFGTAVRAIDYAGEERVRDAAKKFLKSYRMPRGGYRLENAFRYLIAQRS
jgi:ubiquinone/menaquinone biosynthesis C-methylase UbiE